MSSDGLIYFTAVACERALLETDGVASAIRMVDIVFVDPNTAPEKRAPFLVSIMVAVRFDASRTRPHTVSVDLIRVNGETIPLAARQEINSGESKYPGAPQGFNLQLQFALIPANMGTCFIAVSLDEAHVVRIPITFLPQMHSVAQGSN
jgi:hypothetical protein